MPRAQTARTAAAPTRRRPRGGPGLRRARALSPAARDGQPPVLPAGTPSRTGTTPRRLPPRGTNTAYRPRARSSRAGPAATPAVGSSGLSAPSTAPLSELEDVPDLLQFAGEVRGRVRRSRAPSARPI